VIGISLISRSTSETFIHVFQVSEKQGGKNGERSERFRLRSDKIFFFWVLFRLESDTKKLIQVLVSLSI
jgi:hypothetical protein